MSVRNAAAGQITMMAADIAAEAERYDSIGERGIGDRLKRSAAEVNLAASLLRSFGGPPAYDLPNDSEIISTLTIPDTEEPEAEPFKVGDRVRVINTTIYPVGTEFTVTEVKNNGYTDYVMGDEHGYGVIFRNIEKIGREAGAGSKVMVNENARHILGDIEFEKVAGKILTVEYVNAYFAMTNPYSINLPRLHLKRDEFAVVEA